MSIRPRDDTCTRVRFDVECLAGKERRGRGCRADGCAVAGAVLVSEVAGWRRSALENARPPPLHPVMPGKALCRTVV